jgi:hypothetical protein
MHFVQISANIVHWPKECACCAGVPNSSFRAEVSQTKGTRVRHTTTKFWQVPWCNACADHRRWYSLSHVLIALAIATGTVALVVAVASAENRIAAIGIGILILAASIAGAVGARVRGATSAKPTCTATTKMPVHYLRWHSSIHTFTFSSRSYLGSFVAANHGKMMSETANTSRQSAGISHSTSGR